MDRKETDHKMNREGLSLRSFFGLMIVVSVVMAGLLIYSANHLTATFYQLSRETENHAVLEDAAYELMDASDYLTEKVQRFAATGEMRHLDAYFIEAQESNRREKAIAIMAEDPDSKEALAELQQAMNASKKLMNQEYYAMRLVIEAKKYKNYPLILDTVQLTEEDAALSPDEKMRRAVEIVLNDEYYQQKETIRSNMKESLDELDRFMKNQEDSLSAKLQDEMQRVHIIALIQTAGILLMALFTSMLGISPILKAVDRIEEDRPIEEVGAREFRYLAKTYNKMYHVYKRSMEKLSFKASHDELTGAYNRTGYEYIMSEQGMESVFFILIDIDDFKIINDEYGHEMGDRVLIKVVKVIKKKFRSGDYVCRIGGDEFVVLAMNTSLNERQLFENKVDQINVELARTEDGLPFVSVSAGIAYGMPGMDAVILYKAADAALYITKHQGKRGHTFAHE